MASIPPSTVTRTTNGDGRVGDRITNYTGFWEKDSKNDGEEQRKNRLENYTEVVNGASLTVQFVKFCFACVPDLRILGYYDGATELYEFGWARSFHFSRFYKGEGFEQSVSASSPQWHDFVSSTKIDFLGFHSWHATSTISLSKWASSLACAFSMSAVVLEVPRARLHASLASRSSA